MNSIRILRDADAVLVCIHTEGKILSKLGVNQSRTHKIVTGVNI